MSTASACQRARARARAHTHTPRTADADVKITQRIHKEACDEAEERRLQNVVNSELMFPMGQQVANRAAAKKVANRGTFSDNRSGSPRPLTIRERGTKVTTPKQRRAGSALKVRVGYSR